MDRLQRTMARAMAGLALAAILVLDPASAAAQAREVPVLVDPVRREPLAQTVPVIGRLVPRREGEIAARVGGPVARVLVEVGDRVARGDLLVELDAGRLTLARDLARAEHEIVRADLATALAEVEALQLQRERMERLQGSAAFSRAVLEDKLKEIQIAASRIDAARARLASAAVALDQKTADLADARVAAPYAGVVTRRHVSPGTWLVAGAPVADLVDDDDLEIEADVPGERIGGLAPGEVVDVEANGVLGTASVRAIVPVENPLTRTRAVRLVPRADLVEHARVVGQSIVLRVPSGPPRELLTVHKDAVSFLEGRRVVFVAVDGRAELRTVTLGAAVGARFEVLDGLADGEAVVVRGNERLRPGEAIAPGPAVDVPAPPAAARPVGTRS